MTNQQIQASYGDAKQPKDLRDLGCYMTVLGVFDFDNKPVVFKDELVTYVWKNGIQAKAVKMGKRAKKRSLRK